MIPDFQKIMLPFLRILADGEEHSTVETNEKLATIFHLTDDELNQRFTNNGLASCLSDQENFSNQNEFDIAKTISNRKNQVYRELHT